MATVLGYLCKPVNETTIAGSIDSLSNDIDGIKKSIDIHDKIARRSRWNANKRWYKPRRR